MKRILKTICFSAVIATSLQTTAWAKDITLAVGLSLPPYIFKEENKGIEYDIVKTALEMKGHTLTPLYVPFGKVGEMVQAGKTNGAMTVSEASGIKGHYSDEHITYQNFAITKAENGIKVDSIADLNGKSIAAFQNATLYLGDEYKKAVENNAQYTEIALQMSQILALYKGLKKIVISDVNIFKYYQQDLASKGKVDTGVELVYHPIFKPTNYKVLFTDAAVRDDFNAAVAEMRASGKYDEIIKRYVK